MVDWDLDLLGDPIPANHAGRGRPPHIPTVENRRKVIMLAAFDRTEEQIAQALGITPPTLRKHYFRELRSRQEARQRVEGKLLVALANEVDKGNVSAVDKLFKRLDRHDLLHTSAQPKKAKPPKLGKKEQRLAEARQPAASGTWGDLVDQRRLN